jgi:hypothetical protein
MANRVILAHNTALLRIFDVLSSITLGCLHARPLWKQIFALQQRASRFLPEAISVEERYGAISVAFPWSSISKTGC